MTRPDGERAVLDEIVGRAELTEDGVDVFFPFGDQQHIVLAGILLEVVAREVFERAARRELAEDVDALVLEAPVGVQIGRHLPGDARAGAGIRQLVADRGVGRIPVVPVALHENLGPVSSFDVDADAGDVLVPLVHGVSDEAWVGVVDGGVGMLVAGVDGDTVAELEAVFAAIVQHVVAAVAVGRAGSKGVVGLEPIALVVRGEQDVVARPGLAADITIDVAPVIRVGADVHQAVELICVAAGDEVDDAGGGLGSIIEALAALQHLDPFDHRGREGVAHRGGVEAVVDPDAVNQKQQILRAGPLKRDVHVAERASARGDEEPRYFHLERLLDVNVDVVADLLGGDDFKVRAVLLEFLRQGFLDRYSDDHHAVGIVSRSLREGCRRADGEGKHACPANQHGAIVDDLEHYRFLPVR